MAYLDVWTAASYRPEIRIAIPQFFKLTIRKFDSANDSWQRVGVETKDPDAPRSLRGLQSGVMHGNSARAPIQLDGNVFKQRRTARQSCALFC